MTARSQLAMEDEIAAAETGGLLLDWLVVGRRSSRLINQLICVVLG
jgi:hypothetical protein